MLAIISGHYSCYLHRITQWVFSMINTTCPLCYFIQWLCIIHLPSIISFTVGNENTGRSKTFALKVNTMQIDKMGIFFDTFATFFLLWPWEVIPFQPTWILMCPPASLSWYPDCLLWKQIVSDEDPCLRSIHPWVTLQYMIKIMRSIKAFKNLGSQSRSLDPKKAGFMKPKPKSKPVSAHVCCLLPCIIL